MVTELVTTAIRYGKSHPTEYWSKRHTRKDKVIQAEQAVPAAVAELPPLWREVLARAAPRGFVPPAGTHLPHPTRPLSITIVI
ncbi:hypothetical protein ACFYZ2_07345 [Streptomyces sviceus]|uniref:hypothetical protein n=1 Tax=Streptomyces sviceus TaxID=285530 RepID=UPI0036AC71B1